jgi:hypothetical protein
MDHSEFMFQTRSYVMPVKSFGLSGSECAVEFVSRLHVTHRLQRLRNVVHFVQLGANAGNVFCTRPLPPSPRRSVKLVNCTTDLSPNQKTNSKDRTKFIFDLREINGAEPPSDDQIHTP